MRRRPRSSAPRRSGFFPIKAPLQALGPLADSRPEFERNQRTASTLGWYSRLPLNTMQFSSGTLGAGISEGRWDTPSREGAQQDAQRGGRRLPRPPRRCRSGAAIRAPEPVGFRESPRGPGGPATGPPSACVCARSLSMCLQIQHQGPATCAKQRCVFRAPKTAPPPPARIPHRLAAPKAELRSPSSGRTGWNGTEQAHRIAHTPWRREALECGFKAKSITSPNSGRRKYSSSDADRETAPRNRHRKAAPGEGTAP